MIKFRVFLKLASFILLLLFFIPWLITFAIYFGAPFLVACGFGLSAFKDSSLLNSPQTVSLVYGVLILLYYLFPFVCILYFFKVCRVTVAEKAPSFIWMALPFFVVIPLGLIVNYSVMGNKAVGKKGGAQIALIVQTIISTSAPWAAHGSMRLATGASMQPASFSGASPFPHKSYLRTCIGCSTTANKLHCSCQDSEGIYNSTELDLTTVKNKQLQIQNCNGHLTANVENCP